MSKGRANALNTDLRPLSEAPSGVPSTEKPYSVPVARKGGPRGNGVSASLPKNRISASARHCWERRVQGLFPVLCQDPGWGQHQGTTVRPFLSSSILPSLSLPQCSSQLSSLLPG